MTIAPAETPQDVLERLLEGADRRRARSLQLIHEVCEEQRAHGSHDYSLTTIGRLLKAKGGGPSTDSLGNNSKSAVAYRALIDAHHLAYAGPPQKRRSADDDGLLDGVRDPLQRDRIRDLREEVRQLRAMVKSLQQFANTTTHVAVAPGPGVSQPARIVAPPATGLLPYEHDALVVALNPRRLTRVGLVEEAEGRLETEEGEELFPVGFTSGFRKLLALIGGGPEAAAIDGSSVDGSTMVTL